MRDPRRDGEHAHGEIDGRVQRPGHCKDDRQPHADQARREGERRDAGEGGAAVLSHFRKAFAEHLAVVSGGLLAGPGEVDAAAPGAGGHVQLDNGGRLKIIFEKRGKANGQIIIGSESVDSRIVALALIVQKGQPNKFRKNS